jgi:DNA polymerase-1
MHTLFLVDAVNLLFRSYYAIGPMTNGRGESTNALYGFIRSFYKIVKDFSPDCIAAIFDGPENKKARTEIYGAYKGHRKEMPGDLHPQLEHALTFCALAGIPHLAVPGVEADDTIGSIAVWAERQGARVVICSSDKDLCQLVSDRIHVLNPHKDNLLIDREKVVQLFGVAPEQIVDYLALMGDASDNIPGVEGFGPKTASSLLQEFGSLDALLEHPERVPGKKKQEALMRGRANALMSRQLAALCTTVPFPQDDAFFQLKMPDLDKLRAFYHDMRFLSLLKELQGSADDAAGAYAVVDDISSLHTLLDTLKRAKEICVDTETTHIRPMRARVVGIGFAVRPKEAWYVPLNGRLGRETVIRALAPLFADPAFGFAGHNIKYDMHVLLNEGVPICRLSFDTMLASYLLAPQVQRHNLDELSLDKCGAVKTPTEALIGKGKNQITMDQVPIDKVGAYCCEDVDYTCRLKELFQGQIAQAGLTTLLEEIELPLIPVLTRMERSGVYVDTDALKTLSQELKKKIHVLETAVYRLAGEPFNINSPKQLSAILFDKLGIKPPRKTTTGFSTRADVLEELESASPIVKQILEFRTLEKLRSTYVDALPEQVLPETGRIHCTFNQSVAATGRLSCQDPNLQNIPVRSEEGRKIRAAFKPHSPHWRFLSADYSQIELRLLAHLSEDPALTRAFQEGEDIHAYTASLVYNVPVRAVTAEMRQTAKTVNFGVLYGQGPFGLSKELGVDHQEAAAFIETYFRRYKRVKEFFEFCKESVRTTGRAVTMTGRIRPIPEISSKNPTLRAAAERLAINTPLQGTAADLIKIAMIQTDALLLRTPSLGCMLLQIHDELLFESPEAHVDALARSVKQIMEGVLPLNVPLVVDISIGKNWGEC